ncbi:glycosyltransferase family 32 protein [Aeromonas salmonicida]|uniref:glycosyltransferase family 32 protein n=1 Tax=Aeromonas salmonicida TaxID=645 RepID=UPI001C5EAEA7|nr:TcdA/TcdB catalytic glycosyltransferase domain-containing protein [Aeromonas salmonicida]
MSTDESCKVIHAIWLGDRLPPLAHVCIDDWRKQGYTYKLWLDSDPQIQCWIRECTFARECYQRGLLAFVTDYLRLKILSQEGGLYLDTDVTINRDPFPLFESVVFSVGYESDTLLGTAVIYAKKHSTLLSKLVLFYEEEIMSSTLYMGPGIMTELVSRESDTASEPLFIAPVHYFYNYQGEAIQFKPVAERYMTHWFQHSWKRSKGLIFLRTKSKGLLGYLYEWQKEFFRLRK